MQAIVLQGFLDIKSSHDNVIKNPKEREKMAMRKWMGLNELTEDELYGAERAKAAKMKQEGVGKFKFIVDVFAFHHFRIFGA